MTYTIKKIANEWWALTQEGFQKGDEVVIFSKTTHLGLPLVRHNRRFVSEYTTAGGKRIYLVCHNKYFDGQALEMRNQEGADMAHTFKPVTRLPEENQHLYRDDLVLGEAEFQQLLNPHPAHIRQMVEIFLRHGDSWEDDTRERHLDDFNPLAAAEELARALLSGHLRVEAPQPTPVELTTDNF